jgi:hypothetical protein
LKKVTGFAGKSLGKNWVKVGFTACTNTRRSAGKEKEREQQTRVLRSGEFTFRYKGKLRKHRISSTGLLLGLSIGKTY